MMVWSVDNRTMDTVYQVRENIPVSRHSMSSLTITEMKACHVKLVFRSDCSRLVAWLHTLCLVMDLYHHVISFHIVDRKWQNHLKVWTDKSKLKVKMQSVSDDDVRKRLLEKPCFALVAKSVFKLGRSYIFRPAGHFRSFTWIWSGFIVLNKSSQNYWASLAIYSVTCHPTKVNTPDFNPRQTDITWSVTSNAVILA